MLVNQVCILAAENEFQLVTHQCVFSVLKTHSEMAFGCQMTAQGASVSTAKVFLRFRIANASLFCNPIFWGSQLLPK